jgi:2-polyprenyl-6-hydroxyphenyl methylase/3-demethylubiquinone-9 3-methyltransferase
MPASENVHLRETDKFGALAATWWDPKGPMRTLHAVNPLRTDFIARSCEVRDRRVIDIGCGGGVLAESLARLGARVTGVDLSQDLLGLARRHARDEGLTIDYRYMSAEQLAEEESGTFDIATCLEVLEHVPRPEELVMACARLLKPGGHAFFATIDRSLKALLFVIFGAEYVLRLLQIGTHTYGGLIRPAELRDWGQKSNLEFAGSVSVVYNLLTRKFSLTERKDDVYIMHFTRR